MFWALLKKELLQQIHTQKFMILAILSIVLMILSIHVAGEQYLKKLESYNRATTLQQSIVEKVQAMTEETKVSFAEWDGAVFRKPTPLCIFCMGKENSFGVAERLDPMRVPFIAQSMSKTDFFNEFDMMEVLGGILEKIDFTMVVRLLFSLLALFLAFDLVSGEREQGTLKLMHSFSVSRFKVVTGKWMSGAIILAVAMLAGILCALVYLQVVLGIVLEAAHIIRLLALFLISMLYVLVFFQLALFFSCWLRSSQMAIVGMFLVWTISLFITPTVSIMASKQISPLPPLDFLHKEELKVSRKYDELKIEASKKNESLSSIFEDQKHAQWQVRLDYLNKLREQRRTAGLLSGFSPAPLYDSAAEYISGTSVNDYDYYMNRVRQVNEEYSRTINTFRKSGKSFEELKTYFTELCGVATHASLSDIRLPLSESIVLAIPSIMWFIGINGLLYFLLIVYYDRKAGLF